MIHRNDPSVGFNHIILNICSFYFKKYRHRSIIENLNTCRSFDFVFWLLWIQNVFLRNLEFQNVWRNNFNRASPVSLAHSLWCNCNLCTSCVLVLSGEELVRLLRLLDQLERSGLANQDIGADVAVVSFEHDDFTFLYLLKFKRFILPLGVLPGVFLYLCLENFIAKFKFKERVQFFSVIVFFVEVCFLDFNLDGVHGASLFYL